MRYRLVIKMATLYTLFFGKKKSKMKPIFRGTFEQAERLKKAREATKNSAAGVGWHEIKLAEPGEKSLAHKSCSIGKGNNSEPIRIGRGKSGYISKHGFEPNT